MALELGAEWSVRADARRRWCARMSWLQRLTSGWGLTDPAAQEPQGDAERIAQVQHALEGLREALRADHGDVRLVSVVEDTVQLQMVGACATCHALESTKRELIEPRLRAALPWLRDLVVR